MEWADVVHDDDDEEVKRRNCNIGEKAKRQLGGNLRTGMVFCA